MYQDPGLYRFFSLWLQVTQATRDFPTLCLWIAIVASYKSQPASNSFSEEMVRDPPNNVPNAPKYA
jgi:hypothetical protein